jgi:hypothetical protein
VKQRERLVALCRAVASREGAFTLPKLRERFAFTLLTSSLRPREQPLIHTNPHKSTQSHVAPPKRRFVFTCLAVALCEGGFVFTCLAVVPPSRDEGGFVVETLLNPSHCLRFAYCAVTRELRERSYARRA